jgi:hypothetical protein
MKGAIEVMKHLTEALIVIHSRGIVHGNLNPTTVGFIGDRLVVFESAPIEGLKNAFQEDVLAVVRIGAFVLNGPRYMKPKDLNRERPFMFEVSGGPKVPTHIRPIFEKIEALALNPNPLYKEIIFLLNEAYFLL